MTTENNISKKLSPETQVNNKNISNPSLNKSDMRYIKNNFFLGYQQDMTKALDPDLRKFFGLGKKQFKTFVKKPGVKFGFKLSNYISPNDSVSQVEVVLREIQNLQFVTEGKKMFERQLKKELRRQKEIREERYASKRYKLEAIMGANILYYNAGEDTWKVDTNRNIRIQIDYETTAPEGFGQLAEVKPLFGVPSKLKAQINKIQPEANCEVHGLTVTGPTDGDVTKEYLRQVLSEIRNSGESAITSLQATNNQWSQEITDEVEHNLLNYGHYLVHHWFESRPRLIFESDLSGVSSDLSNEGMQNASVLMDNFLKHAGGIDPVALEETDNQCVPTQLMKFFTQPQYTEAMKKIPKIPGSDEFVPITKENIINYLDNQECEKPSEGISPKQLATMCIDLRLNMYALDHDSKCFMRITQFTDKEPRGAHRKHHALVFYVKHKHMYLISHPESIKSISESCKESLNGSKFKQTDLLKNCTLPLVLGAQEAPMEIINSKPSGHYIVEANDLTKTVFDYMNATNKEPIVKVKNGKIIGFTVSECKLAEPVLAVPEKPKRRAPDGTWLYDKHKGQAAYNAALQVYEAKKAQYDKEKRFVKNATPGKTTVTYQFSVDPNRSVMIPAEAVKMVCENAGVEFTNQNTGALSIEFAHSHESRPKFPRSFIESIFAEQEGLCAECETPIKLSWQNGNGACCQLDHDLALANIGTNDRKNLQLLCAGKDSCHAKKTAEEKQDGYGRIPEYHSQLAPSVYHHVLEMCKMWSFCEVYENENENTPEEEKKADYQIDLNKAFASEMYYRPQDTPWPKFSVMDRPQTFSGVLQPGGYYYVETTNTDPFRGCGFYNVCQTKQGLDFEYITLHDIKLEFVPSHLLPADFFVPYIDRINKAFDGLDLEKEFTTITSTGKEKKYTLKDLKKNLPNSFIGTMAPTQKTNEWQRCTLSPATAKSWQINDGEVSSFVHQPLYHFECDVRAEDALLPVFTQRFESIFVGQFKREVAIESTGGFIRWDLMHNVNVLMHSLKREIMSIPATPKWIKTDCIAWSGPAIDISDRFWDKEKTVPLMKHEKPCPPKREAMKGHCREPMHFWASKPTVAPKKPELLFTNSLHLNYDKELANHKLDLQTYKAEKAKYERNKERKAYLSYEWRVREDYDGNAKSYGNALVDMNTGFFLNGRAGTGKTTLANAIISILEERKLDYSAFSTTHVSKNIMGYDEEDAKKNGFEGRSELRSTKGAKTIDSLYSKFTSRSNKWSSDLVIKTLKKLDYVIIDEVGLMREKFYAMLCHIKRSIPALKFILIGDFQQFKAVKDDWTGNPEDSAALFDLCDGQKVLLTRCLRSSEDGQFLFDACTKLINGESLDPNDFPVKEETQFSIGYYHKTLIRENQKAMQKAIEGKTPTEIIRLPARANDKHSQDVTLTEGMPVICINTDERFLKICNGERYNIESFTDIPDYSKMKKAELKQICKDRGLKYGGNKKTLLDRLLEASSDLRLKNVRNDEDIVTIPRDKFQMFFRVAFCITYHQSQGSTMDYKYTIFDWEAYHVDNRAKYVALSRATSSKNVQIARAICE